MRPVETTVSFDSPSLETKLLSLDLTGCVFEHQHARLLLSLAHKETPEEFAGGFADLVGQVVTIEIEDGTIPEDESEGPQALFTGLVSRAGLVYTPEAVRLEVEATSGSKGMEGLPRTRIFQDVQLGDLIDTVLEPYQGGALDTIETALGSLANKQLLFAAQWRESDWDFLLRIARKFGLFVMPRGRDLYVSVANPWDGLNGLTTPVELKLGDSLSSFRLGLGDAVANSESNTYQYTQSDQLWSAAGVVEVGNSLAQQASESNTPPDGNIIELDDYFSAQEFEAVAGRWGQVNVNDQVQGSGICDLPGIRMGNLVSLAATEEISFDPLDGINLFVTRVRHVIVGNAYSLKFHCHADGSPPMLDPQDTGHEPDVTLVSAKVVDTEDSDSMGRVCVKLIPFGEDLLSEEVWVRCLSDGSGEGHGTLNVPEIDDEVILSLDPRKFAPPLMLGSVYNSTRLVDVDAIPGPAGVSSGMLTGNNLKYYLSKAGTAIVHDTTDSASRLIVVTPNVSLILSEESPASFDLQVGDGACQINGLDDGTLTIKAKNIEIEAEQELKVKSGTATKIEAGTDLELKGTSKVKVDAVNYEMKASATAKSEAGATLDVKAGAALKLQGAIININ